MEWNGANVSVIENENVCVYKYYKRLSLCWRAPTDVYALSTTNDLIC